MVWLTLDEDRVLCVSSEVLSLLLHLGSILSLLGKPSARKDNRKDQLMSFLIWRVFGVE